MHHHLLTRVRAHTHTHSHRSSGDPWGFHLWAADFCFLNTRSRRSWRSPYERLIGRRNKRDLVITPREGGGEAGKRGFSTQIVCSPQSVLKEREKHCRSLLHMETYWPLALRSYVNTSLIRAPQCLRQGHGYSKSFIFPASLSLCPCSPPFRLSRTQFPLTRLHLLSQIALHAQRFSPFSGRGSPKGDFSACVSPRANALAPFSAVAIAT
jgi:hypothetical protein